MPRTRSEKKLVNLDFKDIEMAQIISKFDSFHNREKVEAIIKLMAIASAGHADWMLDDGKLSIRRVRCAWARKMYDISRKICPEWCARHQVTDTETVERAQAAAAVAGKLYHKFKWGQYVHGGRMNAVE